MFFCDKPPYAILAHKCPHIVVASFFLCDKPPYCILAPKCPHCHKKENTVCMCVMCVLAYNSNI